MNPFDNFSKEVEVFFSDHSIDFTLSEESGGFDRSQIDCLSSRLSLNPNNIINIKQVHGNKVVQIDESNMEASGVLCEADALVTALPGVGLSVRTADCLPVFFYDSIKRCIGLAHAGWRGTQKNIVKNTIDSLVTYYGTNPGDLLIGLGPCIRLCCYQVDDEVKKFFPDNVIKREDGAYLDLIEINKSQIFSKGVKETNIFDYSQCTCCDSNFFSYRRDGENAGRHLFIISMK